MSLRDLMSHRISLAVWVRGEERDEENERESMTMGNQSTTEGGE